MQSKTGSRKRTRKACTACRKAKTSCSDQRPCTRCVRLKKGNQCIDIPSSTAMSDRDRETWLRVASFLRDPASMPAHVADALEQQVSLVLAESSCSPNFQELSMSSCDHEESTELEQMREENARLQASLRAALAKKEREQSIQHSFYFFGLTTGAETIATSHWSFPSTQLIHYNSQFQALSQREDTELRMPGFTCKRLFMESFVQRCVKILMFLSHGTVTSMTVPQVWKNAQGNAVNVTSMVYIEVDRASGHVAKIMMASTPAGELSKNHEFEHAFLPSNVSFTSDAPINQTLLEECKQGIMDQIYEARSTPPAPAVTQGWSLPVQPASAQSTSPAISSPETYSSSSPSSNSSFGALDGSESVCEGAAEQHSAFCSPSLLPSPQVVDTGVIQQVSHYQLDETGSEPLPVQQRSSATPLARVPACTPFCAQSQVVEQLEQDLRREPWAQVPDHQPPLPRLPLPNLRGHPGFSQGPMMMLEGHQRTQVPGMVSFGGIDPLYV